MKGFQVGKSPPFNTSRRFVLRRVIVGNLGVARVSEKDYIIHFTAFDGYQMLRVLTQESCEGTPTFQMVIGDSNLES